MRNRRLPAGVCSGAMIVTLIMLLTGSPGISQEKPLYNRLGGYDAIAEREQRLNLGFFMPATIAFNLVAMIAVRFQTVFFIEKGHHVIVASLQLAAAFGYWLYGMRFFARIIPLVIETRREWREAPLHAD